MLFETTDDTEVVEEETTDTEATEEATDDPNEVLESTDENVTTEPTPEDIAKEWLKAQGIDPDEFDPKKVSNLSSWEKKLNQQSTELGAIAKQLDTAKPESPTSDTEFDDETLAQLMAAFKQATGIDPNDLKEAVTTARSTVEQQREAVFFKAVESEDVDPQALYAALMDVGVDPAKAQPAQLSKAIGIVAPALKKPEPPVDAEAIAKKAVEDYLASLKKQGVKEDEIVEVKKGRGAAAGAHRSLDDILADPNISQAEKMERIASEG